MARRSLRSRQSWARRQKMARFATKLGGKATITPRTRNPRLFPPVARAPRRRAGADPRRRDRAARNPGTAFLGDALRWATCPGPCTGERLGRERGRYGACHRPAPRRARRRPSARNRDPPHRLAVERGERLRLYPDKQIVTKGTHEGALGLLGPCHRLAALTLGAYANGPASCAANLASAEAAQEEERVHLYTRLRLPPGSRAQVAQAVSGSCGRAPLRRQAPTLRCGAPKFGNSPDNKKRNRTGSDCNAFLVRVFDTSG